MTNSRAREQYADVSESDGSDSFDALYERELDYVWRTLGRLGVPPGDLADASHDVFVVVHRRWAELDHSRSPRPWLFGIARRVAAATRKRHRAEPSEHIDRSTDAPPHAERDLLWQALAAIAEERVVVLVLHEMEGYTGAEIARMLGIPVNTVHSRLRLARADLVEAVERLRGER